MILATHHGPAIIRPPVWLLNVDFLAKDVIGALEVGWTFNENLKTKSFVLVWSTLGEERASGPSNPVLSAISRSGFNENVLVMTWRNVTLVKNPPMQYLGFLFRFLSQSEQRINYVIEIFKFSLIYPTISQN